jgi:hypothetical protein
MIGQNFTYKDFPRDRLVYACQSSSKADVFQRIVKTHPKIERDMLIARMQGHGIHDADRIVTDIDRQIKQREEDLKMINLVNNVLHCAK